MEIAVCNGERSLINHPREDSQSSLGPGFSVAIFDGLIPVDYLQIVRSDACTGLFLMDHYLRNVSVCWD
jgi:hypothetical protein